MTTSPSAAATLTADFRVRPLTAAIGAEIVGLELRHRVDDKVFSRILDTWHQHCVLLFRGQNLSEEEQVAFAERCGPVARIHTGQFATRNPAVMLISNIKEDGKPIGALPDGEMHFHSDQCYQEKPATGSMLYAIEIPSKGGDTLFANAYLAYETLPA